MKYYVLIFWVVIIGLISCKEESKTKEIASTKEIINKEIPSDFVDFYNRFHTDSVFQLERIVFPLKGLPAHLDSTTTEDYRWEKKNWRIHKPFNDYNGTYVRTFDNFHGIINETIIEKKGMFNMQRRFAKLSKKWHLIYYKAMGQ